MTASHAKKASEIDPKTLKVHISDGVKQAFRDLGASVHFSESFAPEILSIVHDIAEGKNLEAVINLMRIA